MKYLQGKSNLRWAMAARSKSKLEMLRSDLAKINPAMKVSVKADLMQQIRAPISSNEPCPSLSVRGCSSVHGSTALVFPCVGCANLDS